LQFFISGRQEKRHVHAVDADVDEEVPVAAADGEDADDEHNDDENDEHSIEN